MTDGEVAAYLAGVEIARRASVMVVDHGEIRLDDVRAVDVDIPEPCQGMGVEQFKYWVLEGVRDAFKS